MHSAGDILTAVEYLLNGLKSSCLLSGYQHKSYIYYKKYVAKSETIYIRFIRIITKSLKWSNLGSKNVLTIKNKVNE